MPKLKFREILCHTRLPLYVVTSACIHMQDFCIRFLHLTGMVYTKIISFDFFFNDIYKFLFVLILSNNPLEIGIVTTEVLTLSFLRILNV